MAEPVEQLHPLVCVATDGGILGQVEDELAKLKAEVGSGAGQKEIAAGDTEPAPAASGQQPAAGAPEQQPAAEEPSES